MPDHFIDALTAKNDGAIDNGESFPRPRENRTEHLTANGPVTVKRLPAGRWSCDDCGTTGSGWLDIERHFGRTEHRVYTELKAP